MKITKRQLRKIIRESWENEKWKRTGANWDKRLADSRKAQSEAHPGHPDNVSMMDLEDYQRLENLLGRDLKVFLRGGYTKEDIIEAIKSIVEDLS
tara:strand:- start:94 stop:378 length:285 start_codon:yes stop_codon:yes gene_type:complete